MLLFPSISALATEELEYAIRDGAVYSSRIEEKIFISQSDRELVDIVRPIVEEYIVRMGREGYEWISVPLTYEQKEDFKPLEISKDEDGIYVGYELYGERYILMYYNDGVIHKGITRYYSDEDWIQNLNDNNEMYTWTDSKNMKPHEGLKENDPVIVRLENENRFLKYCLIVSGGGLVVGLIYILIRKGRI